MTRVSKLTPSQLARKRAKDREAQRAIRARTKEHIERLEHELEELKNKNNNLDKAMQELIRHNKALEEELQELQQLRRSSSTQAPSFWGGPLPDQSLVPDFASAFQPDDTTLAAWLVAHQQVGETPGPWPNSGLASGGYTSVARCSPR